MGKTGGMKCSLWSSE